MIKALEINNLQKCYSNQVNALNGINFEVNQGEFFGLLGPNGAGKSTTIGIISGLVNKTAGQVKIFGVDASLQPEQAKAMIGLVPQEFNFGIFERVIDIITNQAGFYGIPYQIARERAEYYLKKLNLWHKAKAQARTLSGGLKRRLMIARGLIHQPKLLILDEPTAGVDIELRRSTWQFLEELNQQGTTIILTTHNLDEAESLCRQIAIINKGQIIEHTSVKHLVSQLHYETLILDLQKPIQTPIVIPDFKCVQKDASSIEVTFSRQASINLLFEQLTQLGHTVISLRNKSNRLEELFLHLTAHQEVEA